MEHDRLTELDSTSLGGRVNAGVPFAQSCQGILSRGTCKWQNLRLGCGIMKLLPCFLLFGLSALSVSVIKADQTPPAATVVATEIQHTTGAEAKALLDANVAAAAKGKEAKIVVLDVRTASEFSDGHLADAKNVDFNGKTFAEQLGKLDKSKPYFVHCASGGRSGKSLEVFKQLGFKKIIHLDDGYRGWTKAGNPVVK
jgi:phage shock protein E